MPRVIINPELPRILTDDRKTIDLCNDEHRGARCTRERGHNGDHECPFWRGDQYLSWPVIAR